MVLHLKCIFKKYNYEMETFTKMHATIITRKGKSVRLLIKFLHKIRFDVLKPQNLNVTIISDD